MALHAARRRAGVEQGRGCRVRFGRGQLAQYYAGITAIDEQIGFLVDHLVAGGRLDDTLIIVTSDHGDMLGSHGRRAKQVPYAEAVRVPLVWHWPAVLAPRLLANGFFGLVDLAPTLLDLLGLPALPQAYGRSLADALRSHGRLRERVLLGNVVSVDEGWRQGVGEWRGFTDATITYARSVDGTPWLLFDDVTDPLQMTNLVDDREAAALQAWADVTLDALLEEAGDLVLAGEPLLRRLGLVAEWNARERELNGDRARVLAVTG
ncbi:MAG: sulfatase-like hydrolase/transferase [Propionibacteriaceae bacterium]